MIISKGDITLSVLEIERQSGDGSDMDVDDRAARKTPGQTHGCDEGGHA